MTSKPIVAVFGAGQIGTATHTLLKRLIENASYAASVVKHEELLLSAALADLSVELWDISPEAVATAGAPGSVCDVAALPAADIAQRLLACGITHVINALPFHLNVKLADAAFQAECHYFDFTEDDAASDEVQYLYGQRPDLVCATKCGLAPGFVNYVGYDLIAPFDEPDSLLVSVGALPRNVNYSEREPWKSYNLSWSVDGLVNEYIRPCRVKKQGKEVQVPALSGRETLVLDGMTYELANTSGGVGSLTKMKSVPNVCYKTIRYPGHYDYVEDAVKRHHGNFADIKDEFLKVFPFNKDDVIVVYAEATGNIRGKFTRRTFSGKFYGTNGLSGIQCTTAGGAIAVLELALRGRVEGVVRHSSVDLDKFKDTMVYGHVFSNTDRR